MMKKSSLTTLKSLIIHSVARTMAGNVLHELTEMDDSLLQGQFRINGKPLYILVEPRQ